MRRTLGGSSDCGMEVHRKCSCVNINLPVDILIDVGRFRPGDGKSFVRNPRAEEMLAVLAAELVEADRNAS